LETVAQQQGLTGRIHFLGQRNDVRAWMARSELLLLPSRYEGMPNVILEAMAEGLPVVSTRVEGVAELLGDQLEPQSVPREAWVEFFELVFSLANSSERRKALAKANRHRADTEFALDKQLERYEALYRLCPSR
jgi:glycosyltransferase involved in cell wall biosynthesis